MHFEEVERLFDENHIATLATDPVGRRFLKLRSLSRMEHLKRLFAETGLNPSSTKAKALFREAFDSPITEEEINNVIQVIDQEQRRERLERRDTLVSELYKLKVFDWGGLYSNSLERTIVNKYVKKMWRYEHISESVEGVLHESMRGYVLCSWYNHWTSILIEDIFRDHPGVTPAVGQVKKIDFFVGNVPFDLKVTYLPEGFIKESRKSLGLRPELTLLKQAARRNGIRFDRGMSEGRQLEDLWTKIDDVPTTSTQALMSELRQTRLALTDQVANDSTELIRWLYENQGERRFDSANRLFLVLVDSQDYFASWKLKRALPLLRERIEVELDGVGSTFGKNVRFEWKGASYEATSKVILIQKPHL